MLSSVGWEIDVLYGTVGFPFSKNRDDSFVRMASVFTRRIAQKYGSLSLASQVALLTFSFSV